MRGVSSLSSLCWCDMAGSAFPIFSWLAGAVPNTVLEIRLFQSGPPFANYPSIADFSEATYNGYAGRSPPPLRLVNHSAAAICFGKGRTCCGRSRLSTPCRIRLQAGLVSRLAAHMMDWSRHGRAFPRPNKWSIPLHTLPCNPRSRLCSSLRPQVDPPHRAIVFFRASLVVRNGMRDSTLRSCTRVTWSERQRGAF